MRLQSVTALGKVFLDERELALLCALRTIGSAMAPQSLSATMVDDR